MSAAPGRRLRFARNPVNPPQRLSPALCEQCGPRRRTRPGAGARRGALPPQAVVASAAADAGAHGAGRGCRRRPQALRPRLHRSERQAAEAPGRPRAGSRRPRLQPRMTACCPVRLIVAARPGFIDSAQAWVDSQNSCAAESPRVTRSVVHAWSALARRSGHSGSRRRLSRLRLALRSRLAGRPAELPAGVDRHRSRPFRADRGPGRGGHAPG